MNVPMQIASWIEQFHFQTRVTFDHFFDQLAQRATLR
jgi:hypothetical protein